MPQNAIYNYLSVHILRSNGLAELEHEGHGKLLLESRKDEYGSYIRCEGMQTPVFDLDSYTFSSSCLCLYSPDRPELHHSYTICFQDQQKTTYQWRLFFNAQGHMLEPESPAVNLQNTSETVRLSDLVREKLIGLALSESSKLIIWFKKKLQIQFTRLETELYRLVGEVNFDASYDELLIALQNLHRHFEKMMTIVRHPYYEPLDEFINALLVKAQDFPSGNTSIIKSFSSTVVSSSPELHEDVSAAAAGHVINNYTKALELERRLVALREEMTSGNSMPLKTAWLEFWRMMNEGKDLLQEALNAADSKIAAALSSFYHTINALYWSKIIRAKNAATIKLVLEKASYLTDDPVTIGQKTYDSAMQYYVQSNTLTPELLSVLLQYEASLLVQDAKGLPIVSVILSNPASELYSVLERTPDLLLTLTFNRELVALLSFLLIQREPCFDAAQCELITTMIIKHRDLITKDSYPQGSKDANDDLSWKSTNYALVPSMSTPTRTPHPTPLFRGIQDKNAVRASLLAQLGVMFALESPSNSPRRVASAPNATSAVRALSSFPSAAAGAGGRPFFAQSLPAPIPKSPKPEPDKGSQTSSSLPVRRSLGKFE